MRAFWRGERRLAVTAISAFGTQGQAPPSSLSWKPRLGHESPASSSQSFGSRFPYTHPCPLPTPQRAPRYSPLPSERQNYVMRW
eukprot:3542083-Pleurochrysis_carterae.AAC.1